MRSGLADHDRGSAALELVILGPVLLFLLGLAIAAGRTSIAQGSVDAAARDAARQASISRTPAAARAAAQASARRALRQDAIDCNPVVTVQTGGPGSSLSSSSGFGVPAGQPASVSAQVTCVVSLSDLMVPGMPGSRSLTATFTSPLDPYRAR
jgi:Flp pilus assembly protein TadG